MNASERYGKFLIILKTTIISHIDFEMILLELIILPDDEGLLFELMKYSKCKQPNSR